MIINKTPDENPAIPDGAHTFSGIQEINLSDPETWTDIDGYALSLTERSILLTMTTMTVTVAMQV